ncbi:MAG: tetratricopeptide repeat protein [Lachnospiraceae bacterium]|nr:tetratricopeptide repeat protein [Lachnospiraceae bacterium]
MNGIRNKKIILWIICICSLLAAAIILFAVMSTPGQRVKRQLSFGDKYLNELKYDEAILAYEAAIDIDPKCEEAYVGIARAYIGKNELENAVEAVNRGLEAVGDTELLLEMRDNIGERYALEGALHFSQMEYFEAVDAYIKAIDIEYIAEDIYLGIGNSYIEVSEYENALERVDEGITRLGETDKLLKLRDQIMYLLSDSSDEEELISEETEVLTEEAIDKSFVQEYLDLVDVWHNEHNSDREGYSLIYLNDDGIPELCMFCADNGSYESYDIYTVVNGIVTHVDCYDWDNNTVYSKFTIEGRQMQGDGFAERKGIVNTTGGGMGGYYEDGYMFDGQRLNRIYSINAFDEYDDSHENYLNTSVYLRYTRADGSTVEDTSITYDGWEGLVMGTDYLSPVESEYGFRLEEIFGFYDYENDDISYDGIVTRIKAMIE